MKAIAVDDEIYMLETLQEAVSASSDIELAEAFSSCSAALAYAKENPIDVAFLDINMRGIGGLGLAEKPKFYGEYMTQYSWAEATCAMLQFLK